MGRRDVGIMPPEEDGQKIFDCAVPMRSGGYDRGGAYWGMGSQLRVRYTKDNFNLKPYNDENHIQQKSINDKG